MNNKSITGISFNGYKTVEIMVIIQQASNGNMFFNFTLVPLVSHILDGARYITIPGKSYGYCANVLLSINYSAGTVTLIEADVNEGLGLIQSTFWDLNNHLNCLTARRTYCCPSAPNALSLMPGK